MRVLLLAITLIAHVCCQEETMKQGIIVSDVGTVQYTRARLAITLDTDIAVSPGCRSIKRIIFAKEKWTDVIMQLKMTASHRNILFVRLHALSQIIVAIFSLFENNHCLLEAKNVPNIEMLIIEQAAKSRSQERAVQLITEDVTEKHSKESNSRIKRSWFDLGGSALSTVLGVATEQDVRAMNVATNNSIIHMENSMHEIIVTLNLVTNTISRALSHVSHLANQLSLLQDKIVKLDNFVTLVTGIRQLQYAAIKMLKNVETWRIRVTFLQQGILPAGILTGDQLIMLIQEGDTKFPTFVFPLLNFTLNEMLPFLTVNSLGKNVFLITLPWVEETVFVLKEIHAFPVKVNNETLIPINLPKFAVVNGEAINVMQSITPCTNSNGIPKYLCPPIAPVAQNGRECVTQLLLGKGKSCSFAKLALGSQPFTLRTREAWWIYLPRKIAGTITCPQFNRTNLFIGTIKIVPPCAFISEYLQLPTLTIVNSKVNIVVPKQIPISEVNWTNVNIAWHPNETIEELHTLQLKLNESHVRLEKIETLGNSFSINHIYVNTTILMSCVTIAIVLLAIWTYRKRSNSNNRPVIVMSTINQKKDSDSIKSLP